MHFPTYRSEGVALFTKRHRRETKKTRTTRRLNPSYLPNVHRQGSRLQQRVVWDGGRGRAPRSPYLGEAPGSMSRLGRLVKAYFPVEAYDCYACAVMPLW